MIEWNQQDRILDQIQSVFSHFQEAVKKDKDVLVFSSRLSHVGPASRSGNKQAFNNVKIPKLPIQYDINGFNGKNLSRACPGHISSQNQNNIVHLIKMI